MSENKEKKFVVAKIRRGMLGNDAKPVFVFDARVDARDYAARMNVRSTTFKYKVFPVKQGPVSRKK